MLPEPPAPAQPHTAPPRAILTPRRDTGIPHPPCRYKNRLREACVWLGSHSRCVPAPCLSASPPCCHPQAACPRAVPTGAQSVHLLPYYPAGNKRALACASQVQVCGGAVVLTFRNPVVPCWGHTCGERSLRRGGGGRCGPCPSPTASQPWFQSHRVTQASSKPTGKPILPQVCPAGVDIWMLGSSQVIADG